MNFHAVFFDGRVAADRPVTVDIDSAGLMFSGAGVSLQNWRFSALQAVDRPVKGTPLRIANNDHPGARLIVADEAAKAAVLHRVPHLAGGLNLARLGRSLGWTATAIAAVALVTYAVVQWMPQTAAFLLPDSWRARAGEQIEASLVEGAKRCDTAAATQAMSAMMARLAEGNSALPAVSVHVYDIPVMNAFAMPGERIVITSELLKKADAPDEVAGVLAHELGHVVHRDSETAIVRALGVQLIFAVATGGGGGDTLSQIAGLATILHYSREAESDADGFAATAMTAAAIDTLALKRFFEQVLQEEEKATATAGATAFGKIEAVFATHPGTAERIGKIMPLPAGVVARPVMTDAQWQALKAICGA
jgi:beta-barrel assembly-enhancing protease